MSGGGALKIQFGTENAFSWPGLAPDRSTLPRLGPSADWFSEYAFVASVAKCPPPVACGGGSVGGGGGSK